MHETMENSCSALRDLGGCISDYAELYALGDDYCDMPETLQSIEKCALEMVDHLNNVLNLLEGFKNEN